MATKARSGRSWGQKSGRSRWGVAPKSERTLDGIVFHSKGEMGRYAQLKLQERAGLISNLEIQPKYTVSYEGTKLFSITLDFRYVLDRTGETIIEDAKSSGTRKERDWRLRKRISEIMLGISIKEVLI